MTLPKDVSDGMACMRRESDSWHAVNNYLLSQDAEIARLKEQALQAHRNLMDERYSVPAHLLENPHDHA